jgi:hypothetical protein
VTDTQGSDPYDAQTRADVARLTRTAGNPRLDLTASGQVPALRPVTPKPTTPDTPTAHS